MSVLERHFRARASALADCASFEESDAAGATTLRIRPHESRAVGVVLYLLNGATGTVALDDPVFAPIELGEDESSDIESVDHVIDVARDGGATAFRNGRGGCVEVTRNGTVSRTWMGALPVPGWRRRSSRVDYLPYR